ncbi:MAG: hypothetical protein ACO3UU_06835 [Minisyncoccia bacterium]
MKIIQLLESPKSWQKIKQDPRASKLISIAFRQDHTIPKNSLAKVGPKPSDEDVVDEFGKLVDNALSNTNYGDISKDGKFDDWIARQYLNGFLEYEDISGEASDTLGSWKALSIRGLLKPEHQDFNKFRNLTSLQRLVRMGEYPNLLKQIADAERIQKAKRDAKMVTLIDNDRFYVAIPMNYGACYVFNNAEGYQASFCTGGSSGMTWFNRYADEGPIITVFDKQNMDDINGKWQIHAYTNQLVNARQTNRYNGPREFGELFPGLMIDITKAMRDKAAEIKQASKIIPGLPDGYNVDTAIQQLREQFPNAFTKRPETTSATDNLL